MPVEDIRITHQPGRSNLRFRSFDQLLLDACGEQIAQATDLVFFLVADLNSAAAEARAEEFSVSARSVEELLGAFCAWRMNIEATRPDIVESTLFHYISQLATSTATRTTRSIEESRCYSKLLL